jgi:unsaturated chondroitin disaccharide hydrolase
MIAVDQDLEPGDLTAAIASLWEASGEKIAALERNWDPGAGAPVFTVAGRYTARGWTEWTQGFQFGSALLQFDATGDRTFLALGRTRTLERMAPHLTHMGVHDHGFNTVSTYGALWRMLGEGRFEGVGTERSLYELAIRVSGAVQARRWTATADGLGFVHSFNGAHSLFADTIRSLRVLALSHRLGHVLLEEGDRRVSLLERLVHHARTTAQRSVYYGKGRDVYDVRGRVAHESLFNVADGEYRCPGTQQGYSPFTTWTRGLAWVLLGFAEEAEFVDTLEPGELAPFGGREEVRGWMLRAAQATADFYIESTPPDGIPYWDTGAPGLVHVDLAVPADPMGEHEPVDSSAAAIAAQGLLRLGRLWAASGRETEARRYTQAGLTIARTLLRPPYLSTDIGHQGLLLHSVYHRPNGWDHVPPGRTVPSGESSQWGDYHLRELALYVQRLATGGPYYAFFGGQRP